MLIDLNEFFGRENKLAVAILTFTYFVSMFLFLLNWGVYWDDWWLLSLSDNDLLDMFRQMGGGAGQIFGYLHSMLLHSAVTVKGYRIILFLSGYITLLSFYFILQKEILKNKYWAFWTAMLFAVVPLNFAKVTLICLPYSIALALFYFAFTIAIYAKNTYKVRLLVNALFFGSFFVNSLVIFYPIFLLTLLWRKVRLKDSFVFKNILEFISEYWDFVLIPFLFVFFKYFIFDLPHGAYRGYNSVVISLKLFPETFYSLLTVLGRINSSLSFNLFSFLFIFLLVGVPVTFLKKQMQSPDKGDLFFLKKNDLLKIIILSGVSLFLAVVPYVLVGRTRAIFGLEWLDRDTLLLQFGISLSLILIILILLSSQYLFYWSRLRQCLVVLYPMIFFYLFLIPSIKGQVILLKDAIKQDAIIDFMKNEKEMRKSFTFVFHDQSLSSNIYGRSYRDYELNGLAYSIFKDQKRFFSLTGIIKDACPTELRITQICKDWKRSALTNNLYVNESPVLKLSAQRILYLAFLKYFKKDEYIKEATSYFLISLRPQAG